MIEIRFQLRVIEDSKVIREDNFNRNLEILPAEFIAAIESYWRELGELLAPGIVGQFGRLQSVAANKDDIILMEVNYGAMTPHMSQQLVKFFHIKGFENFNIIEVAPGRGSLKISVIEEKDAPT